MVSRGIQGYTGVYKGIQGSTMVYKGIQGYTGVYKGYTGCTQGQEPKAPDKAYIWLKGYS